ncbi:MAG: hypothetical protein ACM3ZQ_10345, partial [Bacillota bacterium]
MWGSSEDKDPIGQVLPDFTVEIDPERLSPSRLATLRQFTEPVSSQAKRYQLCVTSETVTRGRLHGVTSREIMFLLRHIHGRDLPENVASTVAEWAEGFGRGVLQRSVWLQGERALVHRVTDELDGLAPLIEADETTVLLSQVGLGELAGKLIGRGTHPGVRPLAPTVKAYEPSVGKETGLFNHSLRAVYDLYCCLRDNNLHAVTHPSGRLYRRLGQRLGAGGRAAKLTKEQKLVLRTLAEQRVWDAQQKLVGLYIADQEYSEISGFDQLVSEQVVRELDHLRQPQQVRQKVADYLRETKPVEWTSLVPFVRRLRKESPKVIRATRSWDWSYLRRQDRPWEEVEDYWLAHLLTNEFWWL